MLKKSGFTFSKTKAVASYFYQGSGPVREVQLKMGFSQIYLGRDVKFSELI